MNIQSQTSQQKQVRVSFSVRW